MGKITDADGADHPPLSDSAVKVKAEEAKPKKAAANTEQATTPALDATEWDWTQDSINDEREFLNVVFYGESGSGKSTAAARLANYGRVLVINAEGGMKPTALNRLGIKTENLVPWPPRARPGQEQIVISAESLEALYWKLNADLIADPDSWVGVIFDSGTEITKAMLDSVTAESRVRDEAKGKDRGRFQVDLADYGTMSQQGRWLLRRFRDLPCHFVVTCLERRDQDDDGSVRYGPAMTPALAGDLFGYVDMVLHTEATTLNGVDEYSALTRTGGKYTAKDRFGVLPRKILDPFTDRLVAYVSGDLNLENDPVMRSARERREAAKGDTAATTGS